MAAVMAASWDGSSAEMKVAATAGTMAGAKVSMTVAQWVGHLVDWTAVERALLMVGRRADARDAC